TAYPARHQKPLQCDDLVATSRVAGGVSLGIFNLQVRSLTSDARQVSDLPATFLKFFKVSDL
ncbi:MAG TPA: hypothetical protein VGJ66_19210, partial [Pyrinomonadaceae bacterium]